LVLLGLLFSAGVYPLIVFVKQDAALAMMMILLCHARYFLDDGSPKSIRESELDRLHGMVELCPRGANGCAGAS
jgi:hypothetical protein